MPRMTHTDNRYTRSAVSFSDQEEADKTTFAVLFVLVVNFHIIQMWLDIVFIFQLFKGTNLKLTFKAKKYPVDKPKPHEEMSCSGLVPGLFRGWFLNGFVQSPISLFWHSSDHLLHDYHISDHLTLPWSSLLPIRVRI